MIGERVPLERSDEVNVTLDWPALSLLCARVCAEDDMSQTSLAEERRALEVGNS